jgi:hypothetical protein
VVSASLRSKRAPHHISEYEPADLPTDSPYLLEPGIPSPG